MRSNANPARIPTAFSANHAGHGRDHLSQRTSGGAHRGTAQPRAHRSAQSARCVCQPPDAPGCIGGRADSSAPVPRHLVIKKSATIAMELICRDLSRPQAPGPATEQDGERTASLPADTPTTATPQFQPLDPGIVNEAIPGFFIGRNKEGFWVARDVGGRIRGIFLLENSALAFAKRNSRPAGCATIFLSERFELDL